MDMITRSFFLLLSCVTLFAQRTPFHVNGTVINNPNLTNSASITWTVVGANITGAAAGGPSGDSIWTNNAGLIELIGSTNVILNPSVADGASAVAFSLNSSNALSTSGAKLLTVGNDSTNVVIVTPYGGMQIGPLSWAGSITEANGAGVTLSGAANLGNSFSQIDMKWAEDASAPTDNTVDFYSTLQQESAVFYNKVAHAFPVFGSLASSVEWQIGTNNVDFWLTVPRADGSTAVAVAELWPSVGDGGTPYHFDTPDTHTSGNLVEVKNNGSAKVQFPFDGRIILAGTTNQVVFGSTNTAPSSTASPTKWISVQVSGESATYRIPLYE